MEVAPEVVELLVERGYSPSHGARFLQREIEKTLTAALAVEIAQAAGLVLIGRAVSGEPQVWRADGRRETGDGRPGRGGS